MPKKIRLLYVYRLRAGFSQEGLAEKVGVPQESISTWEGGLSIPEEHLQKLWEIFDQEGVLPKGGSPAILEEEFGGDIKTND